MIRRYLILLALASFVTACGDDSPPKSTTDMGVDEDMPTDPDTDVDPPGDFDVELQPRGTTGPFVSGQEVELVSGFQGGFHIDVNLFVEELPDEANGIARARVRRVDTSERFAGVTAEIFAANWRQVTGGFVYSLPPLATDGFIYPDEVIDQPIELEVTTTMDDGAEDRDLIELVLVDDVEEIGDGGGL